MSYNVNDYNAANYNAGGGFEVTLSPDLFVFNGFSLSNNSTLFIGFIEDNMPVRRILGGATPREDGEYFNADYWQRKIITARGWAKAADATALELLLDNIREQLAPPQKFLDITRNSVVRRYTASLINGDRIFSGREGTWVTFTKFEIQFLCKTPFAEDRGFSSGFVTVTTSPTNLSVCNEGTIEAEPVIVAIFDSATDVTALNVKNLTNDDEIDFTGTLTAGDQLEFDSANKTVKLNGTEVDYTGSFPTMDVGANLFQFTTTGTSFDYTVTVKFKNRFL